MARICGAFYVTKATILKDRVASVSCVEQSSDISQSKLGVFLRDNGLMYLANVALDRCPV